MADQPILATRFASDFTILTGALLETSSTIAWPSITIDYGNSGSTNEPPTRSYTGIIDNSKTSSTSLGTYLAILLPLSNESIFVQEPLGDSEIKCSVHWLKRRRFI